MRRSSWRGLAVAALVAVSVGGCGSSKITQPEPETGVIAGGLSFIVLGAGYSTGTGSLPAADASVAAPVVTLTGSLAGFASAQLNVSASEPFQTMLLLPVGSTTYARVAMPGNATLIGVITTRVPTSSFSAQQLQVAIVRGGKVSAATTISLLTPQN